MTGVTLGSESAAWAVARTQVSGMTRHPVIVSSKGDVGSSQIDREAAEMVTLPHGGSTSMVHRMLAQGGCVGTAGGMRQRH